MPKYQYINRKDRGTDSFGAGHSPDPIKDKKVSYVLFLIIE